MTALKPSVEVSPSGSAVRLLDHATGRFLDLSEQEGTLVALYDGSSTMEALAARAQAEGLMVDAPHAEAILERVRRAGFLLSAAAADAATAPGPAQPLLPSDRVPLFRPDLKVMRKAARGGLMEVFDPQRDRAFSLYDFEVSIANMLNGQRTAEDVISAAARIGIPVNLDSLGKFIRQLRAYEFIDTGSAPADAAPAAARPPRTPWTPEIRQFFQSALKHFRAGRMEEALGHLEALLQMDATNSEALELKDRIGKQLEGSTALTMLFNDLHGDAPAAPPPPVALPDPGSSAVDLSGPPPTPSQGDALPGGGDVDAALRGIRREPSRVPAPIVVPSEPMAEVDFDADFAEQEEVAARTSRRGALTAAAALSLVMLAGFPVPSHQRIPCEVGPRVLAEVTAGRAGRVVAYKVKDGDAVEPGQVVAELGAETLAAEQRSLKADVETLRAKVEEITTAVRAPAERARAVVERAQKQVDRALAMQARLDDEVQQVARARAALTRARQDAADRQAALDAARRGKKAGDPSVVAAQREADGAAAALKKAEAWSRRTRRAQKKVDALTREVTRAQAAHDTARAALARVAREAEVNTLREQLRTLEDELAELDRGLAASAVTATARGAFSARHPVGTEVAAGHAVGDVTEPGTLAVRVAPEAAGENLGAAVLVLPDGKRVDARFTGSRVVGGTGDIPRRVELVLEDARAVAGAHGPGALEVAGPRRPWWWVVLGR